jgi:hypothetical protein
MEVETAREREEVLKRKPESEKRGMQILWMARLRKKYKERSKSSAGSKLSLNTQKKPIRI